MKLSVKNVLIGFAVYEVVAYAFNSWQVSKPSAVGQAVFTLPFDFISTLTGGYFTATNPTGVSGFAGGRGGTYNGLAAYMGAPVLTMPTRVLKH